MKIILILVLTIYGVHCERIKLTCEQIRAFVDGHNFRRLQVANGLVPGQPAASDMQFMVWNEELAEKASKWAEKGQFEHNPDRSIGSNRWNLIGENIYVYNYYSNMGDEAKINIQEALNSWFQEHKYYNFVPFFLSSVKPFGHYTQVIGNYLEQKPYTAKGPTKYLQCNDGYCDKPYGSNC
ncbi:scoloptoxin SSD558-like [Battus philenor]|uniref:scoloptoxin SSD558-like n=1 Tax=Battus philenor TaxID=42288 RepID=UPI0035D0B897